MIFSIKIKLRAQVKGEFGRRSKLHLGARRTILFVEARFWSRGRNKRRYSKTCRCWICFAKRAVCRSLSTEAEGKKKFLFYLLLLDCKIQSTRRCQNTRSQLCGLVRRAQNQSIRSVERAKRAARWSTDFGGKIRQRF